MKGFGIVGILLADLTICFSDPAIFLRRARL